MKKRQENWIEKNSDSFNHNLIRFAKAYNAAERAIKGKELIEGGKAFEYIYTAEQLNSK